MGYSEHKISTNKHIVLPRKNSHVLMYYAPYLLIMATSPQWPLSSVPKVTVLERFRGDCIIFITCYIGVYVAKNLLKAMHEST